jgi:prepilin-type N-terminal cleavage/methylation domain-containing protein
MKHSQTPSPLRDDGFGLVEVIVAMFLLVVLAVAVLPAFISGIRASQANQTIVVANSLAAKQLATVQAQYPASSTTSSCAALPANTAPAQDTGTGLYWMRQRATCPASTPATNYPAVVSVTISICRTSADCTLAANSSQLVVSVPSKVLVAKP